VAFVQGMSARDIAWSFWVSSWITGSAYLVAANLLPALSVEGGLRRRALAALFFSPLLAFSLFHFGAVHRVIAGLMDGVIPLGPEPFSLFGTARVALERYWPTVLLTVLREGVDRVSVPEEREPLRKLGVITARAYLRVLRMHAFIMVLGVLALAGFESFAVFACVFVIYFAPPSLWRVTWRARRRAVL